MKLKSLALGGALVAMFALAAVGCNENPVDTPGAPGAPSNVQAVSMSTTSVGLKWDASVDVGVTYKVSWAGQTTSDAGSMSVTGTSTTVTNLKAEAYVFTVRAVNADSVESSAATVTWAPARRFNTELGKTTEIRMYEFASDNGSGLILDPDKGGPKNQSAKESLPDAVLANVQLAIFAGATTFEIGPAFAFTEYAAVDRFDHQVFVSDSTYLATSLDNFYRSQSLDKFFTLSSANTVAYPLQNTVSGTEGRVFFVRLQGNDGMHYARVFVKNNGGKLLQGTAPDRYVELVISYQETPNLPYAKVAAGRAESPADVAAHRPGK